jgi:uncharacterized phiE125 gp8 family phage protein
MIFTLKTGPTETPISLDRAKAHLREIGNDEDEYILHLIQAAVGGVDGRDGWLGRCLCTQVWTVSLDAFPAGGAAIKIGLAPVQSVDAVRYLDPDGVWQTWASTGWEALANLQETKLLLPAYGKSYPAIRAGRRSVEIDFTAGYGTADDVPDGLQHGLLMLIGHWFENREEVVTGTIATKLPVASENLLRPFRVYA